MGESHLKHDTFSGRTRSCRVRHDAMWTSLYGHLSAVLAKEGEKIEKGKPLGKVGSTDQSTSPHLRFELRQNGKTTDPQTLLKR